jgi:imidazolonepropionase-like amidohydrolase
MRYFLICCLFLPVIGFGQSIKTYLLLPSRIFDGEVMQENWAIIVEGERIKAVGPTATLDQTPGVEVVRLPGVTLLPGLIEAHSHLFLHPYNETSWNDQVLRESLSERVARATVHARKTLEAGFTTVRDLGTEGAGYADVGLKTAIDKGIVPGPRMLVVGPAIVATGSYGPKGFAAHVEVPQGADEASGREEIIRVVRNQIGKGVDLIKVYADYHWGPKNESHATFSLEELQVMVETAKSSGRAVVAHASTPEGMRRAILAGVETIEHGDEGTPEVFKLMAEKGVAYCPTLAAGDAILQYRGWKKGIDPEPEAIRQKRSTFSQSLKAGVAIAAGGDVGVYSHGDNVRELELMVDYGMTPLAVLRSATSVNARVFHLYKEFGHLRPGFFADIVGVQGNPEQNISDLRKVKMVMKGGTWAVKP